MLGQREVLYFSPGIGGDGLDAVFHAVFRGVPLAGADDLGVGIFQVEKKLAIGGLLALKFAVVPGIFTHGFNAIFCAGFAGIALAGENDLSIFGFEPEVKFSAFFALIDLKHGFKYVYEGGIIGCAVPINKKI